MARSRFIKGAYFLHEDISDLVIATRLFFIGLWTLADREGRIIDRPRKIHMALFPRDTVDVDAMLNELAAYGFVHRYRVGDVAVIQVMNWGRHQSPHHREAPSVLPPLPASNDPLEKTGAVVFSAAPVAPVVPVATVAVANDSPSRLVDPSCLSLNKEPGLGTAEPGLGTAEPGLGRGQPPLSYLVTCLLKSKTTTTTARAREGFSDDQQNLSPGEVSKLLRGHNISGTPSDPKVIALSDQQVPADVLHAACAKARESRPTTRLGVGYIVAILTEWATEAEAAAAVNVRGARSPPARSGSIAAQQSFREKLLQGGRDAIRTIDAD
jgi:hypothetical protein